MSFKTIVELSLSEDLRKKCSAHVDWTLLFERNKTPETYDIKASYVLKKEETQDYRIILQLDHQKIDEVILI